MKFLAAWVIATAVVMSSAAAISGPSSLDAAFAKYWAAQNPADAAKASGDVVKTSASFDEVYRRLKQGRPYSKKVSTGIVFGRHGEFSYALDVPPGYDPARAYQVRFQLHGGVAASREANERRGRSGIGRLAGTEQIYVLPAGWNEAPWWSDAQVANLSAILDTIKRTYNIDENRVVVSGVSDGGTGAYYVAMRDTTPYAAFLPLNGFILVLTNVTQDTVVDLCPNNLRNKPFFAVNGGRDPLYPISIVEPSVEHLAKGGVDITYRPQPQAGHDTSWWPQVKDAFETFVRDHPRSPLPDRLTWETSDTRRSGRAHWLQIDALGTRPDDARNLPDLNQVTLPAESESGSRSTPGLKVARQIFKRTGQPGRVDVVRSGNVVETISRGVTQFTLLISPDQFDFSRPVRVVVNGRVAFDGPVEKSVATLMKWAARDNDRTMLFGAELKIAVK